MANHFQECLLVQSENNYTSDIPVPYAVELFMEDILHQVEAWFDEIQNKLAQSMATQEQVEIFMADILQKVDASFDELRCTTTTPWHTLHCSSPTYHGDNICQACEMQNTLQAQVQDFLDGVMEDTEGLILSRMDADRLGTYLPESGSYAQDIVSYPVSPSPLPQLDDTASEVQHVMEHVLDNLKNLLGSEDSPEESCIDQVNSPFQEKIGLKTIANLEHDGIDSNEEKQCERSYTYQENQRIPSPLPSKCAPFDCNDIDEGEPPVKRYRPDYEQEFLGMEEQVVKNCETDVEDSSVDHMAETKILSTNVSKDQQLETSMQSYFLHESEPMNKSATTILTENHRDTTQDHGYLGAIEMGHSVEKDDLTAHQFVDEIIDFDMIEGQQPNTSDEKIRQIDNKKFFVTTTDQQPLDAAADDISLLINLNTEACDIEKVNKQIGQEKDLFDGMSEEETKLKVWFTETGILRKTTHMDEKSPDATQTDSEQRLDEQSAEDNLKRFATDDSHGEAKKMKFNQQDLEDIQHDQKITECFASNPLDVTTFNSSVQECTKLSTEILCPIPGVPENRVNIKESAVQDGLVEQEHYDDFNQDFIPMKTVEDQEVPSLAPMTEEASHHDEGMMIEDNFFPTSNGEYKMLL